MAGRATHRPTRLTATAILLSLLVLTAPGAAFAAKGPWQSVDLTLIGYKTNSGVLLVTGHLPASAALPAKVSLAVPAGAQIGWVGEILGTAATKDPNVKYSVEAGRGYDSVSFVLTQSHTGQVECAQPNGYLSNGSATQASFFWVAPFDIATTNLAIQFPSGASVTGGTPGGKTVPSGSGSEYDLAVKKVSQGQTVKFVADYAGGATSSAPAQSAAQPVGSKSAGSSAGLTRNIIAILAIAVFFLLMFLALRYVASSSPNGNSGSGNAK